MVEKSGKQFKPIDLLKGQVGEANIPLGIVRNQKLRAEFIEAESWRGEEVKVEAQFTGLAGIGHYHGARSNAMVGGRISRACPP